MSKRRLKLAIPPMQCVSGCQECCGIVPVTAGEVSTIRRYVAEHSIKPIDRGVTCPFAHSGKCAVYPVRPRICQAYGHSVELECPHGRNVNVDAAELRAWVLAPGMVSTTLHTAFLGVSFA